MGSAKREMERHDAAQRIGIEIGVRAGVLDRCDAHGCWWTTGDEEEARNLAREWVRDRDPRVEGYDLKDILDGIKAAFKEAGMDECAHCRSIMDKD